MAKHVLYDAVVVINSVTLTDRCRSINWNGATEAHVASAMSELQTYKMPGVLVVEPITMEFYQDYAATNVYITLKALWAAQSVFVITAKASSASDSATNPNFTISAFVGKMPFLNGSRGETHLAPVTFEPASIMTFDVA